MARNVLMIRCTVCKVTLRLGKWGSATWIDHPLSLAEFIDNHIESCVKPFHQGFASIALPIQLYADEDT